MDFKNLDAWKKAKGLALDIYKVSKDFPNEERFGLTNQIRRCAVSVPSNIAEGMGRQHKKESIQFFYISKGSLFELETQLIISKDLDYLKEDAFKTIIDKIGHCNRVLSGLIRFYRAKE